jgi:hypothetical protein
MSDQQSSQNNNQETCSCRTSLGFITFSPFKILPFKNCQEPVYENGKCKDHHERLGRLEKKINQNKLFY